MTYVIFFALVIGFNGIVTLVSLPLLKKLGRGLTVDTAPVETVL